MTSLRLVASCGDRHRFLLRLIEMQRIRQRQSGLRLRVRAAAEQHGAGERQRERDNGARLLGGEPRAQVGDFALHRLLAALLPPRPGEAERTDDDAAGDRDEIVLIGGLQKT
jgi:hypothetical protein